MSKGPYYHTVWAPAVSVPVAHRTLRTELSHIAIVLVVSAAFLVVAYTAFYFYRSPLLAW